MNLLSLLKRKKIPDMLSKEDITTGLVAFDYDLCVACGVCVISCPSRVIGWDDSKETLALQEKQKKKKKGRPYLDFYTDDMAFCIACGCCAAGCGKGAITVKRANRTGHYYQKLTQTEQMTYPKRY